MICVQLLTDGGPGGWVRGRQTGMPMTALSVAGANWRLKPEQRGRLFRELLPWALRAGHRCSDLMCLYYENHFHVRALGQGP